MSFLCSKFIICMIISILAKYCLVHQVGECRWSKGGKPVGMWGGKYELLGDTGAGDCSLTIVATDLRIDDGQWQCQVSAVSAVYIKSCFWIRKQSSLYTLTTYTCK